ncbi:LysR substrate-binding domain-containing protein [Haloferula sp. BvORR071]|uniref:LysR substrate-binding domain-containing protein n=1 Tax=Haloferula sp. BvORR071 TaxID=1396141 RepID=UPI00069864D9|nr:LysR substrate-binding domain-containing protein [Haloferula sp. BvORR071]
MELRHLRYFVAVAEEENVTRAAARLHVAQPSLSRQIRDLEDELGVPLFEHAARTVRLTDAGRHFLKEAREAMAKVEDAIRSVREFAHGNRGEIHVGFAPSLTTRILPAALRTFQERCPAVHARLHDLSTEGMLAGLRDGVLGAALLVKPSAAALEGMAYEEIFRFRPRVALPMGHRLAALEEVPLAELAEESLLAYSRADYPEYHTWLELVFKGTRQPRIAAEYDGSTSLIAAIESGCGVAMVQDGFETLAGARLVLRPVDDDAAAFSFGVAWRKDDGAATTREFVAAVTGGRREP